MEVNKSDQIIKEYAENCLNADKLKNFIDFLDFLKKNKLGKAKTGRKVNGSWAIQYKNKMIGSFVLGKIDGYDCGNSWSIRYFNLFSRNEWFEKCEKHLSAEMKDFVLSNINNTSSCCVVEGKCHPVENKIILGKMFTGKVCSCRPIKLNDPNGKTLEYAKELAIIGKTIIAETAESSTK